MVISNQKRQIKGGDEKYTFNSLKGDKAYGDGNTEPLLNKGADYNDKDYYDWLSHAD